MDLNLFTVDAIKTKIINETKKSPLVLDSPNTDGTGMLQKELEFVLNLEIEYLKLKMSMDKLPIAPSVVKTIMSVAKQYEDIGFTHGATKFTIQISSEIYTNMNPDGTSESTLIISVHIQDPVSTKKK